MESAHERRSYSLSSLPEFPINFRFIVGECEIVGNSLQGFSGKARFRPSKKI